MKPPLRILLGVSGGIASYKAPEMVRRWRDRGVEVRCALTETACRFVSPLSLEIVTGHPVHQEGYLEASGQAVEQHIELTEWADAIVLAPATANLLSQAARGMAPNFLTTTLLAWDGPLFIAPAMHPRMWNHAAIRANVEILEQRGAVFFGPEVGPLASGEVGMGRMVDPLTLVDGVVGHFRDPRSLPWAGKRVLVSAGPTHEPIDPVRYLGNRSSGRMGFAIAEQAVRRGAQVDLVAGPAGLATPRGVDRVSVGTALEMRDALLERLEAADVVFMTAAVADYRPADPATSKVKKANGGLSTVTLVENPDILLELCAQPGNRLVVGFAAETNDLAANSQAKLVRKGCDLLVANDVSRSDIGFGNSYNEVTVFRRDGEPLTLSRRPKSEIATTLLDLVEESWASLGNGDA